MATGKERILIVEPDPEIADLIARQSLTPLGYRVQVTRAAEEAINEIARFAPDLVIANLSLPGLSGKDLLVALNSQGLESPVVVIARKPGEGEIVQAFRLGASDYLRWPAREAEVVAAVERALTQVRARRERELLARQLNQSNQELQKRVRELTTIFAIGKAVISVTDRRSLYEKIVEGAVYVAEADCGWLLLRENRTQPFVLSGQRSLPESLAARLYKPWDDGLSSLVALSGESLAISGDPLKRFQAAQLGRAALVAPLKIKNEVLGLLAVMRQREQPFSPGNQSLLEAVADYASISLVNTRLFQALEERARSLQQAAENARQSEENKDAALQALQTELAAPLAGAIKSLEALAQGESARLNATQKGMLRNIQDQLAQAQRLLDGLAAAAGSPRER
jgi:DNA-binding response OmpR family regulator